MLPPADPHCRPTFGYPVGVLLFNRPEYAAALLDSLSSQSMGMPESSTVVVVDGFRGSRDDLLGRPDRTAEVADLAAQKLPKATLIQLPSNAGVAGAMALLEEAIYSLPHAQWGAFFEEDFVLEHNHLEILSFAIQLVQDHEDVAVVSVSGDSMVSRQRGLWTLYPLNHLWAYALRRDHYRERQPLLDDYLAYVRRIRYHQRTVAGTYATCVPHGVFPLGTSQDHVKKAVARRLKRRMLTLGYQAGRYVGMHGEHFTPHVFRRLGYHCEPRAVCVEDLTAGLEALANLDWSTLDLHLAYESEIAFAREATEEMALRKVELEELVQELRDALKRVERDRDALLIQSGIQPMSKASTDTINAEGKCCATCEH